MTIKSFLYSMGIACWISAPLSHLAIDSWTNSENELIEYEEFKTVHQGAVENMRKIAEAEMARLEAQQKLIEAEKERQEKIINDARYVLESYEVVIPEDIKGFCDAAGEEFNVCPELLEAICWEESRFDEDAENKGCSGIMQISVKWHKKRMKELKVKDIYDAKGNIRVGASYLSELFEKYDGDLDKVLKEYNGDTSKGVSTYVLEIIEISEALERVHGK